MPVSIELLCVFVVRRNIRHAGDEGCAHRFDYRVPYRLLTDVPKSWRQPSVSRLPVVGGLQTFLEYNVRHHGMKSLAETSARTKVSMAPASQLASMRPGTRHKALRQRPERQGRGRKTTGSNGQIHDLLMQFRSSARAGRCVLRQRRSEGQLTAKTETSRFRTMSFPDPSLRAGLLRAAANRRSYSREGGLCCAAPADKCVLRPLAQVLPVKPGSLCRWQCA